MELFSNGKVLVTDTEVNIKRTFRTIKIQRKHIKNISYVRGFWRIFFGLVNICLIVNIVRGFKMLSGNILTTIWQYNGDKYNLWLTENEYNDFSNVV